MGDRAHGGDAADAFAGRAAELRPWALARLEALVMAESPSGDRDRGGVLLDELALGYGSVGAECTRAPGPVTDHLVCRWPGAGSATGHVLLIGHSDTVFPAGTTATRPFRLADDGDTVTGPGVFDMKGSLVLVELAMRLVAESAAPLTREVRLVVVSDEEIGSPHGRHVVAEHAEGAAVVIGLEPPLPDGGLKVGRRGVARYAVTVEGVEGHAGLDADRSVSAIDELVDQLVSLRELPTGPDHSVNVGTVAGGTGANVVAGRAQAEVGLRFGTAAAERELLRAVESLKPRRRGATVSVRQLSYRPAWAPDPANPLAADLVSLAKSRDLDLPLGTSGGAGDTNATGAAGLATVDGLGPVGFGAHATTESASVRSLLERAALLATYLVS